MTEPTFDPCCNCGRDTFIRLGELFCDRPGCRDEVQTEADDRLTAATQAAIITEDS